MSRRVGVGRWLGLVGLLGTAGVVGATAPATPAAAAVSAPVCAQGMCTVTFSYSGSFQAWQVPAGVTDLAVALVGGNGWGTKSPGLGGVVVGHVQVTPGDKIELNVGGGAVGYKGGYNLGGSAVNENQTVITGGGGGATELRMDPGNTPPFNATSEVVMVAGGGGGADRNEKSAGGNAGGDGGSSGGGGAGKAGTQTMGGAVGAGYDGDLPGGAAAGPKQQGFGGEGGGTAGYSGGKSVTSADPAGAGGGGWWGGGGGGGGGVTGTTGNGGGGGGGSDYTGGSPDVPVTGVLNFGNSNPTANAANGDGANGIAQVSYDDPAPEVDKVSPDTGSTQGGETVTVTGLRFTGATSVSFAGANSPSFTVTSDTSLTAVVPAQSSGPVDVQVTGPAGVSETSNADAFTYADPVATSIAASASPASIPADGASTSTLTATVRDQFGTPTAGSGVAFTSTDPGATIGNVTSKNGVATATYTAGHMVGAVTITAKTTSGPSLSAMTTVTQTAPGTKPTPTPSASPTSTVKPTPTPIASPTASPTTPAKAAITLLTSGTFVPVGTDVAYTGKVTIGGGAVPGIVVALTETYVDGKTVSLGQTTTLADGSYRLTSHPLYIGTITATAMGASASAPSRVIVTYRAATAKQVGGKVKVHAETRPGFITASNRQERAQILLVDGSGRQLKVLGIVNAAQRKLFPGEAQGTNAIDATVTLPPGKYHVEVKVIGTPVNTGAPTKPIAVTVT